MDQPYKFWIGGVWKDSPLQLEVINPYNNRPVGTVCYATASDIETAIGTSVAAFEEMKGLPAFKRADILHYISEGLQSRKEEIARMITLESGKPIKDARTEVNRAINTFQIASEETKRVEGALLPLDLMPGSEGRVGITRRFPIGPIVGITPFNFPINLVAHKIAPALAAGNTIILKPAPQTPITALLLAEIIASSGAPHGTVNILPCSNDLAEQMVCDPRIPMLSFTGSAAVGWSLKSKINKKKALLELGGNAGVIVHADADLDRASKRCAVGSFSYSGQVCISVQRIFVHASVYTAFMNRFVPHVQALRVGDPMDEETEVSSMIDIKAALRAEAWINEAVAGGAKIVVGGGRQGALLAPTVLTQTSPQMKINCEESFAPLVTVTPYQHLDEAIEQINGTRYGLQAGFFTKGLAEAFRVFEKVAVGGLILNDVPTYRIDHMPYGGIKESGVGREGVRYAMEEMTDLKFMALCF